MLQPDPIAIAERYEEIKKRISYACTRAGRSVDEITLVAVSKTFPESYIRVLYDLGHRDFGENKVQELVAKSNSFQHQHDYDGIRWHMIGHLQRNKVTETIRSSHLFHALDSLRLAKEINNRAEREKRRVECLVQVNISAESTKYGIAPDDFNAFLATVAGFDHVVISGVMGMARLAERPENARSEFVLLNELKKGYSGPFSLGSTMSYVSMGMSHDFEVAIEEGATHIRIGSAIFGERTYTNQ